MKENLKREITDDFRIIYLSIVVGKQHSSLFLDKL